MVIYFSAVVLLYCILLLRLIYGWRRLPAGVAGAAPHKKLPTATVVIPIRNERDRIGDLLDDLDRQSYPHDLFEAAVIDDGSEDGSYEFVKSRIGSYSYKLSVYKLQADPAGSSKKQAIALGVRQASAEIILTTDGDCRAPSDWIAGMAEHFAAFDLNFAWGMTAFHREQTFFQKLQTVEFASLTGVGAASLQAGFPNMCNAANMAFRKDVFLKLGGYRDFDHVISGDDEFLLHKFYRLEKQKVRFIKDRRTIILTLPQSTIGEFYEQRKRWASKWKAHKTKTPAALAAFIFLLYLSLAVAAGLTIAGCYPQLIFAIQLFVKMSVEFAFLINIFNFLRRRLNTLVFLALEVLYPAYALVFGLAANAGEFTWKGRTYKI